MNTLAFFGTSHTQGVCNDFESGLVPKSYCEYIGHLLDRPVKNFGLSGINNETMLAQITYDFNSGYLDDCSTLVIEPRLNYDYVPIPFDNLENKPELKQSSKEEIYYSREFNTVDGVASRPYQLCIEETMSQRLGTSHAESLRTLQDNLYGKDNCGDAPNVDELRNIQEYVKLTKLYMSNTKHIQQRQLEFIRVVQLLCKAHNKEFYWYNYEVNVAVQEMMEHITDYELERCLTLGYSVREQVAMRPNYKKDFLCGCMHINQKGQFLIAEILSKGMKK